MSLQGKAERKWPTLPVVVIVGRPAERYRQGGEGWQHGDDQTEALAASAIVEHAEFAGQIQADES